MYDLAGIRAAVVAAAASFDAGELDLTGAVEAVELWAAVEHAAAAAKAIAAARVAACGPPAGAPDAASWLAGATGTTSVRARDIIRAGEAMHHRDAIRAAATAGALSFEQTSAIADAASANPAAEARLVRDAATESVSQLRQACARVKAAADPDPAATEARIHAQRSWRRYRDRQGAEHLHVVGTTIDLAKVDRTLAPLVDGVFNDRRAAGVRESFEAYAYDAFMRLIDGAPVGFADASGQPKLRYLTLVRVDLGALQRGRVDSDDELCEITGLGPVPVSTARGLLGESVLKLVITKGADVVNVTHLGRGASAAQKIALLWQQPLCTRQGCGRRHRIENDHRDDWARVHCTELRNLDPLCHADHLLKTRHGWALVNGTGTRPMVPPGHPDHPRHARAGRRDDRGDRRDRDDRGDPRRGYASSRRPWPTHAFSSSDATQGALSALARAITSSNVAPAFSPA